MPSVLHDTTRYTNNRAEVSHQPTRRRERQMRRFKSVAHPQRFLAVHDVVRNLFTVGRHRLRAGHQRLLRSRAFVTWNAVPAAGRVRPCDHAQRSLVVVNLTVPSASIVNIALGAVDKALTELKTTGRITEAQKGALSEETSDIVEQVEELNTRSRK